MTQAQIDSVTAGLDYSLIIGGIASIAAVVAGVIVVNKGIGFLFGAMKKG